MATNRFRGGGGGMSMRDLPFILLTSCAVLIIGTTYLYFLFKMTAGSDSNDEAQDRIRALVREATRQELGRIVDVWASERREDRERRQEFLETLNDLKKLVKQQKLEIEKLKASTKDNTKLTWKKLDKIPKAVNEEVERVARQLTGRPKLQRMFKKCFVNTLETTTEMLSDGTTHVITGDIPAMWLRDSSAQVISD